MRGMIEAAKSANGRSRSCKNCFIRKQFTACPPYYLKICYKAFNEGFKKGVRWAEEKVKNEEISRRFPQNQKGEEV